jgi:hypothetical protein
MAVNHNKKRALGEAGEQLVVSRLLRLGYTAMQLPNNWQGDDILTKHGFSVQVKTTGSGKLKWMIGQIESSRRRYFALVDYREPIAPEVYVMKSQQLADLIAESFRAYEIAKPHVKDVGIRTVQDPWPSYLEMSEYPSGWSQKFLERWDLLPGDRVPL